MAILNPPLLPIDPVVKSYFRHYYNEDVSAILTSNKALHKAIVSGDEVALGLLKLYWIENCRKGFDVLLNRKDQKGCGALHYATFEVGIDTTSCARFILSHKVDVNIKTMNGFSPAMLASAIGNSNCLEYLLKNKADVNLADNDGVTSIMVAKTVTVATMLLKAGASVNRRTKQGLTALCFALFKRNIPVIHRLLDFKADINAQFDGMTALMIATYRGWEDVVQALLERNANVEIQFNSYKNITAIIMASMAEIENEKIAAMLVAAGSNVNVKDLNTCAALHYAVVNQHCKIVRCLLKSGADPNVQDRNGVTPMRIARAGLDDSKDVEWIQAYDICKDLKHYGANEQLVDNYGTPANVDYAFIKQKAAYWIEKYNKIGAYVRSWRNA